MVYCTLHLRYTFRQGFNFVTGLTGWLWHFRNVTHAFVNYLILKMSEITPYIENWLWTIAFYVSEAHNCNQIDLYPAFQNYQATEGAVSGVL